MREPYRAVHRYPRNESGRDFVVGDIHGCFAQLHAELEARNFDPRRDRLFAVGDLVDRGPQSDCLLEAVERYGIRSVKGNHEDVIVRWHAGEEQAFSLLGNGADWLLDRAEDRVWVNAIAAYMASLPYLIEIETEHGLVGIVHADSPVSDWNRLVAEIEREKPDGKTRRKAIWSRTRWKTYQPHPAPSRNTLRNLLDKARYSVRAQTHAPGRIENVTAVIVGHTPVSGITAKDNVLNIDTGAVYGGKLTIFDLADLPKWVDVTVGASVRSFADEAEDASAGSTRREPAMAATTLHADEPVFGNSVARAEVPVLADSLPAEHEVEADAPMLADRAVAGERPAPERRSAAVEHAAGADRPAKSKLVDVESVQPPLAPEAKSGRQPSASFAANTMHITVRMSMFSLVSERQQGAATGGRSRRR
jgi:serine/threonine protein phosphatase 1